MKGDPLVDLNVLLISNFFLVKVFGSRAAGWQRRLIILLNLRDEKEGILTFVCSYCCRTRSLPNASCRPDSAGRLAWAKVFSVVAG